MFMKILKLFISITIINSLLHVDIAHASRNPRKIIYDTSIKIRSSALLLSVCFVFPSLAQDIQVLPDSSVLKQPLSLTGTILNKENQINGQQTKNYINKAISLVPIIEMRNDVILLKNSLNSVLSTLFDSQTTIDTCIEFLKWNKLLHQTKYDTLNMKRLFNAYADNILDDETMKSYDTSQGTGMPSLYQTNQYLIRNEIITSIEELKQDYNDIYTVICPITSASSTTSTTTTTTTTATRSDESSSSIKKGITPTSTSSLSNNNRDYNNYICDDISILSPISPSFLMTPPPIDKRDIKDLIEDCQKTLNSFQQYLYMTNIDDYDKAMLILNTYKNK